MVSVEMATLTGEPGSRAAELEWSQPIPAETARRIACDCALTPIVDGEPHGTGRVVPGSMKRALVVRDKRCRFPGCDIPAAWTDAHHIRHWADGGPTKLWNLILLCRRHHRLVHEGRWQLVGAGDNQLQAVPP
jgi:predicted restriction endonuclease